MKIKSIDYHRNGVMGAGFWAVLFKQDKRNYLAIAFTEGEDYKPEGRIAILDTDLIHEGNINFGENSWRYENFADGVLAAIKKEATK